MSSLTRRIRDQRPLIHEGGSTCAGLSWSALDWLESTVRGDMRTCETGAGLSTIVFAAAGSEHTVVTPVADEERAIRAACAELGISPDRVRFAIGPSQEVLPTLEPTPFDLVLVDGAHGFPYAILDWWELGRRLRVGGLMLLDDAYIPPVLAILDGLRGVPSWRVEEPVSDRTALLTKLGEELPPAVWPGGAFGGAESFRYLSAHRRFVAALRHRAVGTSLGQRAVAARRKLGR